MISALRRLDEPEDQAPHYKFYYSNEARMLANADIPKRSLAIAKEVGFLTGIQTIGLHASVGYSQY